MDKNTTYIIIAVVAIVVVAAAAFVIMNQGGSSDDDQEAKKNLAARDSFWASQYAEDTGYPARLLILGNADKDDDIDDDDITYINKLIKNGYTYVSDFMADANNDGLINDDDVAMVKKLKDYNNYNDVVYYFNCDFEIAKYNMSYPLHTSNILTQTLEMLCILAPESVVAVDDRCASSDISGSNPQGTYWMEYYSVLDYSKLMAAGTHKAPRVETYMEIAKQNGGYFTPVMNSKHAQNTGYLEEALNGTGVQIVRIPSWEKGGIDNGMLTLGYLFHKFDRATEWVAWHDKYYNDIMSKVAKLTDDERKKVVVAVLGDTDTSILTDIDVNYTTSAEYQGMKRMGVIDVVDDYLKNKGSSMGGWSVTLSRESFVEMCQQAGGVDVIIGTVPGPYNVAPLNPKNPSAQDNYDYFMRFIDEYIEGTELQVIGWEYASGPHELVYYAMFGNVVYGWDYDIEKITNESLKWMGVYGDGDYQWTFESIKSNVLSPWDI